MRYSFSSLDLHMMLSELKLESAKVEKIYQPKRNDFLFVIHLPGEGKQILMVRLPGVMFLTDFKGEMPEEPTQFCLFLRKHVSGGRIRKVEQLGFERIVRITIETKEAIYYLYIELFSTGNLILCSEEGIIRSALNYKAWKDRTIRGGIKYVYPEKKYNALDLDEKGLSEAVSGDKESVVKALALDLGLGGKYAEELCARARVDKTKKKLSAEEISSIFKELDKLRNSKIQASICDGEPLPFGMVTYKGRECQEKPSFGEAVSEIVTSSVITEEEDEKKESESKARKRIEKMMAEQEETIKSLEASIADNQRKGELIFEKYLAVSEIISELNKAKKKHSWKDIKAKLKGHPVIKEINEKDQIVVVEL